LAHPADIAIDGGNLLPRVERRHQALGSLGGEQKLVVGRVAVERLADAEQLLPVLARDDVGDGVGERLVGGGEPIGVLNRSAHARRRWTGDVPGYRPPRTGRRPTPLERPPSPAASAFR